MASSGPPADGIPSSNSLQVEPQVAVHSFDPDATPAEKGAAAARSGDANKLRSIIPDEKPEARGTVPRLFISTQLTRCRSFCRRRGR
jgi:hypothetical protein